MNYLNLSKILVNKTDINFAEDTVKNIKKALGCEVEKNHELNFRSGEDGYHCELERNLAMIIDLVKAGVDYDKRFDYEDIKALIDGKFSWGEAVNTALIMLNGGMLEISTLYLIGHIKLYGEDENNLSLLSRCLYEIFIKDYSKYEKEEREILFMSAKSGFERVIDIMPSYYISYYYLGFIYLEAENFEKAMEYWGKAIGAASDESFKREVMDRMNDADAKRRYKAGTELFNRELHDEALVELLPAYDLYSDWWQLSLLIGKVYRQKGMYREAVNYQLKALEFNTGCVEAYNELGMIHASMDEISVAYEYFSEALKLEPDSHVVMTNIAVCMYYDGKKEEAKKMIETVTAMFPDEEIAAGWHMIISGDANLPSN